MRSDPKWGYGVRVMTTTREEKTRVSEISRIADKRLAGGIPCFVQIYGKDIGRKYPLDKVQTTIGRGPDNHIVCDMDNVSRNHCKIFAGAGGSWIEDMGSTNGTFVNGGFINRARLKHGDVVHFEGGPRATRLMLRVLLGERPLLDGACRHDGWVILDGATTVPGCQHRAFRRVDADTVETGTAVATGPEELATPSRVAPATGFRVTADGAGIPAGRLLQMLRTGQADAALNAALDPVTDGDTVDVHEALRAAHRRERDALLRHLPVGEQHLPRRHGLRGDDNAGRHRAQHLRPARLISGRRRSPPAGSTAARRPLRGRRQVPAVAGRRRDPAGWRRFGCAGG